MFKLNWNVLLAVTALEMAKVSINYACIGPFYEYEKPKALVLLVDSMDNEKSKRKMIGKD
ncbi:MAG: hypothetical protein Q4E82_05145 [Peptococcaceae bacterium]|nr:hypothetical protein [Peptococcaceae bacterium]